MIRDSDFRPAWWLRSPHLQTIWPNRVRRGPKLRLETEHLETPDGDFLDLRWAPAGADSAPVVVVFHGVAGSIRSAYIRGILSALAAAGWRAVLMHFRGASGEPNRLPRMFHSGETEDMRFLLRTLRSRYPRAPLGAIGFSLGGNVLLKYLGEDQDDALLDGAVAVSVPLVLTEGVKRFASDRMSNLYARALLMHLKKLVLNKESLLRAQGIDVDAACAARSFEEFDDAVTAPLHGFADAHDYYVRASSRQYLSGIRRPTLIIQSADDPFMTPEILPAAAELPHGVEMELCRHGGHVGFVSGAIPGLPRYWLEERIPAWLGPRLGDGGGGGG